MQFVIIHYLTSYPGALINRDGEGLAKRLPFGGVVRNRISSQCLKRRWRTATGEHSLSNLGVSLSVRSRETFERLVVQPLIGEGLGEPIVRAVTDATMDVLLGKSAKAHARRENEENGERAPVTEGAATKQILVLGQPEVEFIISQVREICDTGEPVSEKKLQSWASGRVKEYFGKEGAANMRALAHGAGLDAALFGRMVTSDALARVDSAISVSHALTVHAAETEADFFSAVDELRGGGEGELGSGHINSAELTSGLYYGCVVVNIPQLLSNLGGDSELAGRVCECLIHLIATVSPGARRGATAPFANASLMLAEVGDRQCRTLENAFIVPVTGGKRGQEWEAYRALSTHVDALDRVYGPWEERKLITTGPREALSDALRKADITEECAGDEPELDVLARWVGEKVRVAS